MIWLTYCKPGPTLLSYTNKFEKIPILDKNQKLRNLYRSMKAS